MLFCKSSTVKLGTIALICTASCVVATITSLCSSYSFICRLAGHERIFKRGRAKRICGDGRAWPRTERHLLPAGQHHEIRIPDRELRDRASKGPQRLERVPGR